MSKKPDKNPKPDEKPVLTNADIFRIHNGLRACANLKGRKFAYAVARNAKILEKEIKLLKDSLEKDDNYPKKMKEYYKNRDELTQDKAKPEAYEKLEKKYKDTIKQYKEIEDEMMKEPSDIELVTVNLNNVPDEVTGGALADILEMIID